LIDAPEVRSCREEVEVHRVGDEVGPEDTVCLVQVMKLFNSIEAGVSGHVVRIVAEKGAMVEYGQILILIEAASA
jgi:acetyl-CoA carboxylase biotin carboxyl carrier protein